MDNKTLISNIYNMLMASPFLRLKTYLKDDIIANYIQNRKSIYFLLEGSASLIKIDRYGREELLEKYSSYDFFGEMFHNILINNEMSVIARKKCIVVSFDYEKIKEDKNFLKLNTYLFELVNNKMRYMNTHTEILSAKSIRDKLLTYFNTQSTIYMSKNFELDITYTELASYLNIDRSAMMRELSELVKDKVIKKDKKRIKILY